MLFYMPSRSNSPLHATSSSSSPLLICSIELTQAACLCLYIMRFPRSYVMRCHVDRAGVVLDFVSEIHRLSITRMNYNFRLSTETLKSHPLCTSLGWSARPSGPNPGGCEGNGEVGDPLHSTQHLHGPSPHAQCSQLFVF